jgi:flagellar motor switch protein FliN/FliY
MVRGAFIDMDANQGDPILIYANNQLIARVEIMVIRARILVPVTETPKHAAG